jgi:hypothetical protein
MVAVQRSLSNAYSTLVNLEVGLLDDCACRFPLAAQSTYSAVPMAAPLDGRRLARKAMFMQQLLSGGAE